MTKQYPPQNHLTKLAMIYALVALCRHHSTLLVIAGQVLEEDTHE